jgi:hypothetical protein
LCSLLNKIASSTCRVPIIIHQTISQCFGDYSLSNEDHQTWFSGWLLTNDNRSYFQSIQNAFIYQTDDEINSYNETDQLNTALNKVIIFELIIA